MKKAIVERIGVETVRVGKVFLPSVGGSIVSQLPPIPCYYVTSGGTYYVTSDGEYYLVKDKRPKNAIRFADAEVERIILANTTHENTNYITKDEAEAVTSIGTWFQGNTNIVKFNELKYFKNCTTVARYAFKGCTNLKEVDATGLVLQSNTFMSTNIKKVKGKLMGNVKTFSKVTSNSLDLSELDVSDLTSGLELFYDSANLQSIDTSTWDTRKFTSMSATFRGCSSLTSLDLSNFDTSACTSFESMLYGCKSLTSINVSSFNTSSVIKFREMFYGCSSLTSLDLSNFDTSACTSFESMLYGCNVLTSLDLSNFDTSSATNINYMLTGLSKVTSFKVSSSFFNCAIRDTNPLTDFSVCRFSSLTSWKNVSEITDMLNALPDLANGGYTATSGTLQLSSATKSVITSDMMQIATDKGWTIN